MNPLVRFLRRRSSERDLDRELQFHLDRHVADLMRAGLSREQATRQARLALGGPEQVKEATRDAWGARWIEDASRDARLALRGMVRAPGFTVAVVLTLGVGIGATTAVWSITDALLRRSLPVERPDELYALLRTGIDDDHYRLSYPRFRRFQQEIAEIAPMAAVSAVSRVYAGIDAQPEAVQLQLVSGEYFRMLGVPASLGRVFADGDASAAGANPIAVLSHGFWSRRFGGDSSVIGRTITLNRSAFTIVGVAAPGFQGLTIGQTLDLWAPVTMQHEVGHRTDASSDNADSEQPWVPQEGVSWLTALVRVPPELRTQVATRLGTRFRSELPDELADRDSASRAHRLNERLVLEARPRGFSPLRDSFGEPLRILMGAVGLLLLIACANIAGLLMARGAVRRQEVALRVSLGARPSRLVRQLLAESLLLAALGGALGIVMAQWGSMAIVRRVFSGASIVPLDVSLNAGVLGFAAVTTLATGLLFGIAPALQASRGATYYGTRGVRATAAGQGHRVPLGRILVASQIALSLLLVTSAGLVLRSLVNIMGIDAGYEDSSVITARLDLRSGGYPVEQLPSLYERLQREVAAVPGVRSVSLSAYGVLTGFQRISGFTVPGRTLAPGTNSAQENFVSPEFFSTVGMRLLRGREFTALDRDGAPRVAIVSESMARRFFGSTDVVGARFGFGTPPEFEIVGVVADARVNNVRQVPRLVFYPLAQGSREYIYSLEARVTSTPAGIANAIRSAIGRVDAGIPVGAVRSLRDTLDSQLWRERLVVRLAGAFGLIALLIAAIGLYGVVAYSASRRTNEMGVRLALGASPTGVRRLVLGDSLVTVLLGIGLGVALSIPALRLTRALLFGVSPHDPASLAVAAILLLITGLLAAAVPAWRASRIDPIAAIRAE
jgi:predicted permease